MVASLPEVVASLPEGSKVGDVRAGLLLKNLWVNLPHPPLAYMGAPCEISRLQLPLHPLTSFVASPRRPWERERENQSSRQLERCTACLVELAWLAFWEC